jgi:hypothetical protein
MRRYYESQRPRENLAMNPLGRVMKGLTNCSLMFFSALFLAFALTATSHAALIDNNNGTVTDTDTNLMWLQNADTAGGMSWDDAMAWAANLTYAGYDDWRLPTTPGTVSGWQGYVNEGELAHLFYDHGIRDSSPGPFTNVQFNYYWTGTPVPGTGFAFMFYFPLGYENYAWRDYNYGWASWAVRDVGAVPEPTTIIIWSLLGGLGIALAHLRRRKAA